MRPRKHRSWRKNIGVVTLTIGLDHKSKIRDEHRLFVVAHVTFYYL